MMHFCVAEFIVLVHPWCMRNAATAARPELPAAMTSNLPPDPKKGTILAIPPIALGDLRESTKDYLLSEANRGKLPTQVIRELLDRKAAREGYKPVAAPTFYLNSSPAPDGEKGED